VLYMANEKQTEQTTKDLLRVIAKLVQEVHSQHSEFEPVALDSAFEKDLGLDSLSRVELIARVEKQFDLALPERIFAEAETGRDLLRVILGAETPRTTLSESDMQAVKMGKGIIAPVEAQTLIDILDWHVSQQPERPHIQIFQDDGKGVAITFGQLKTAASKVASGLQQFGLKRGEAVSIMLPSGPEYFFSFYGILMAGGIPVPIYPPARPSQLEDHLLRHSRILSNCLTKILITVPEANQVAQLLRLQVVNLQHITTVKELSRNEISLTAPVLNANDVAFIQYTSGSTGNPKGVVLTHANLLANIRAMGQAVQAGPGDVFVSWLPLYHDMGLIGAWLGSLYFAALFVVMQPLEFLVRPERWLWAIHHYRGTLAASPNFGYEYCLRRIKDEEIDGLDLSSWRAAFNGAEAVSPETMDNFTQRFATYGFDSKTLMPVYGLAESSVGLAFTPLGRGPLTDHVERNMFMRSGQARPASADDQHALKFASCGLPLKKHQIRIVDGTGHELPERREGQIEFRGPSSTSGYFHDAEKTKELFDGAWLVTGDLGYIANGELYVTGRIKDIIIRAGRNIYPHELEEAVGNIDGIRNGRVAVFGSEDKQTGTEHLVVLAETRSKDPAEREKLYREINILAADLIGSPPDEIVLAPPGTVLKTSSGKIRRAASRELFEKGEIGKAQRSVVLQVLRLAIIGILPQIQRILRMGASIAYAIYCWMSYAALAPIAWLAVTLHPQFSIRWRAMSFCSRLLAKITATGISVNGIENIPIDSHPYVLVANHSSFLDAYVLAAILPEPVRFVAKRELTESFLIRAPLKKINTEFVDRFATSKSVQDSEHLTAVLKSGHRLLFFPEGTFTRAPGLLPFHLGAFNVAAKASVPVIPIAIRGTRSILRGDSMYPQHGSIHIEIGQPIFPQEIKQEPHSDSWRVSISLRDQCRQFILRHCGEPDLTNVCVTKL
jgi:acyl carrier protein